MATTVLVTAAAMESREARIRRVVTPAVDQIGQYGLLDPVGFSLRIRRPGAGGIPAGAWAFPLTRNRGGSPEYGPRGIHFAGLALPPQEGSLRPQQPLPLCEESMAIAV